MVARELRCACARLRDAVAALPTASDPAQRRQRAESALPLLQAEVPLAAELMRHLFATVSTRGELGTVANWQQHVLPRVFEQPAREIEQALGRALPQGARFERAYVGADRLVVPTDRTALEPREPLRLEAIVLGDEPRGPVQIAWRPLGGGSWTTVPFERAGRGVWRVALPSPDRDFEYAVEATSASGAALQVPAGGRTAPRTVVIAEWPGPQLAR